MKKKKVLSILLAAVMATAMMAGCGGKEEDTSTGEKKETENKTVSIMGWYDEDDMEGVINAVNEQLDGAYTLEYTYVALSDYNNVLGTQLASGEGPDRAGWSRIPGEG